MTVSRKTVFLLLILTILGLGGTAWGQSRIPVGSGYLGVTGSAGQGDQDRFMVAFFEVPDTVTGPIYFAIESPGMEDGDLVTTTRVNGDNAWNAAAASYSFHLLGGSGTLSGPNARNRTFADLNAASTGAATLATLTSSTHFPIDAAGWYTFPAVYAHQGEKIGNKFYFKVIAEAPSGSMAKNGFRLDASYSALSGVGTPSPITSIRAFAFTWTLQLINGISYNLFPFVPDTATGNLMTMNFDMDSNGTLALWDISANPQAAPPVSTNDNESSRVDSAYSIGTERNGTWRLQVNDGGAGTLDGLNMTEFWFEGDYNGNNAFDASDEYLRAYSQAYPTVTPNRTTLNPAAQTILAGTPADAWITMQIVDTDGNPALFSRNVRVEASGPGSPTVNGVTAVQVVRTNADGLASFFVRQSGVGLVTITLVTDGTGGSDDFGAGTDDTATIDYIADPLPSVSSASNTTFVENAPSPQNIAVITLTDLGIANITDANNLRIILPAGLGAIFDNSVPSVTVSGANAGTWNVAYADANRTAIIDVPGAFAVGSTSFAGLRLASPYTVSSGSLGISWDGNSIPDAFDDKVITITSQYTTYVWNGAGTDWSTATNWTPNGVPDTNTEDAYIPFLGVAANYPVLPDVATTVRNITIESGASVTLAGGDLSISGTIQNNGTLIIAGAGRPDKMDTDSGLVRYTVAGGAVTDFGGNDYYNLELVGTGTFSLSTSYKGNGSILVGPSAIFDIGTHSVQNAGSFTNNGTIRISGGGQTVGGAKTNGAGSTVEYYGSAMGLAWGDAYHHLTINGTGIFPAPAALTVTANLTLTSGTLNTAATPVSVAGNFVRAAGGALTSSGTVTFNGTGAQTFNPTGSTFANITVNKTGGTLTLDADLTLSGTLTSSLGEIATGDNSLSANLITESGAGAVLNASGQTAGRTVSFGTSMTLVAGGFTRGAGTVVSTGTGTLTSAGNDLGNLTKNTGGTLSLADALVLAGSLNIAAGTLDAAENNISLGGDWTNAGTFTHGGGTQTVMFNGGGAQAIVSGGTSFNNLTVNKGGGTLTAGGNISTVVLTMTSGGFTIPAVNMLTLSDAPILIGGTLTLIGALSAGGINFPVTGATVNVGTRAFGVGAMSVGSGTFSQTGDNGANVQSLSSLAVSGGTCTWDQGSLSLGGALTQTGGTLNLGSKAITGVTGFSASGVSTITNLSGSDITVGGNVTFISAGVGTTGGTSTVRVNGVGDLSIGTIGLNALVIGNDVTVTGAGAATDVQALTFTGGSLAVGVHNFQAASATVTAPVTMGTGGIFSTSGAMTVNTGGSVAALAGTNGAISAGNGLTLNGTGTVSVVDGNLTVSAGGVTLNGSGAVQATGSGAIAITGNLTWAGTASSTVSVGSGNLGVTGNFVQAAGANGNVTAGAGGVTIGGTLTNHAQIQITGGSLSVTGAGPHTNAGTGTITTLDSGIQSYTGAVTNAGVISGFGLVTFVGAVTGAGTINSGTGGVTFQAGYTGGILNGSTAGTLTFQGNTVLGILAPASSPVAFTGTLSPQNLNTNAQALPSVTINKGVGNVLRVATSNVIQTGNSLTIQSGILDLNGQAWIQDSMAGLPVANTFTGVDGSLALALNSELRCVNLVSQLGHSILNSGVNSITASGNVEISGSFTTPLNNTLTMTGAGPASLLASTPIGYLTIIGNVILANDLELKGDMVIDLAGFLDVDMANDYTITCSGDWINNRGSAGFEAREGTVAFSKPITRIIGSTTWYIFIYEVNGGTIQFSNNPDLHTFTNLLRIYSTGPSITITKDAMNGDPGIPLPNLTVDRNRFWDIALLPGATLEMNNVTVRYSNADQYPIIAPGSVTVSPYFVLGDPINSHFNYKWLSGLTLVYSYTEDSDRNGKIDRIRVQAAASIGNNFSGFIAEVSGYEVVGYSRPVPGANFYIHLREKPYTDTDVKPSWNIVQNTTLADEATNLRLAQTITQPLPMVPTDTAQPRIAYTLSIPNYPQMFIHFSETVYDAGAAAFALSGGPTVSSGATFPNKEFLLDLSAGYSLGALASGAETVTLSDARDNATPPFDESITNISLPQPTYPVDYTYSSYAITGPGLEPPNRIDAGPIGAAIHRVSDVLISLPPSAAFPNSYFIWPIWAKDEGFLPGTGTDWENLSPSESASLTVGLVRAFDGTQWLRDQNITIQSRVATGLIPSSILFDSNVAPELRGAVSGLWLPPHTSFSGLASFPNTGVETSPPPLSLGSGLWNHELSSTSEKIFDRAVVEFWYRLDAPVPADLYAGRLDIAPGAPIPPDWYRRVRPFGFSIRELLTQRSGVTILNNVIDPTKGERTRLNYILSSAGQVTVTVFTLDGDVVQVLQRGRQNPGDYTVNWDGRNRAGNAVARGIYFIRIVAPGIDEIRKVMVVKD